MNSIPFWRNLDLISECNFQTSRSGGAGGQHVNKVSTKVELNFPINDSVLLTDEQKKRFLEKATNRINEAGILKLTCDETRSQHKNKTLVIQKFWEVVAKVFFIPKKRIPTKISKSVLAKLKKDKIKHAEKKSLRRENSVRNF